MRVPLIFWASDHTGVSGTGMHFMAYAALCGDESCGNGLLDRDHESFYAMNTRVKLLPAGS